MSLCWSGAVSVVKPWDRRLFWKFCRELELWAGEGLLAVGPGGDPRLVALSNLHFCFQRVLQKAIWGIWRG